MNRTTPILSIVTISHNQSRYLRQCVESVLSQKDADVEYTVVDPGSTDGSRDILISYGSAIDRLILDNDEGPADGLNKGFRQSTGEFGYFINSDDFMMPGSIKYIKYLLTIKPNADLILGGAWMVNSAGVPMRELRSTKVDLRSLLDGYAPMVQQGLIFRRNLYTRAGEFNPENRTCWDYELLCAMSRIAKEIYCTSRRIAAFRVHDGSLSGGVNGEIHLRRYEEDLERIYKLYTGRNRPARSPLRVLLRQFLRLAQHPIHSGGSIWDRIDPSSMRRRWLGDFNS